MTFAAPIFLLAGAGAGAVLVILHLLARRDPPKSFFPTARFVPESRERAPAFVPTPDDRLLLLLRLLAIALAALAFSRPDLSFGKRPLIRIILADTSRYSANPTAVAATVAALRADADRTLQFGPSLSAGLVTALAEAARIRDETDSIAIVVVSPIGRGQLDSATVAIRAAWPGALDWRRVDRTVESPPILALTALPAPVDPLAATLALLRVRASDSAPARILRNPANGADSAWARMPGHRLIAWDEGTKRTDTVAAIATAGAVVVGAFRRTPPTGAAPSDGTPVAWWVDGVVAATEAPLGAGCVRTVDMTLPTAGDLVLRPAFAMLVRDLLAPCGGTIDASPPDSGPLREILGDGPATVATAALPHAPLGHSRATPWLIGAALIALLVEQGVRRRRPG